MEPIKIPVEGLDEWPEGVEIPIHTPEETYH